MASVYLHAVLSFLQLLFYGIKVIISNVKTPEPRKSSVNAPEPRNPSVKAP